MKLGNEELAEALYERCVRIERKFGNLMLQTEGAPPRCAGSVCPQSRRDAQPYVRRQGVP